MHLTEIAYYARKIIVFGIIAVVLITIGYHLFNRAYDIATCRYCPVPLPTPNKAFGKLPEINLTDTARPQFAYSVETLGGGFDGTPSAKVYYIPQKTQTVFAPTRARQIAALLGFTAEPEIISVSRYKFTDPLKPEKKLTLDLDTFNFTFLNPSTAENRIVSGREEIIKIARNFFARLNLYPSGIDESKTAIKYLENDQLVRVDFFKADIDGRRLITENYLQSQIYVVIKNSGDPADMAVEAQKYDYPAEANTFATYPLIPINDAWANYASGSGKLIQQGQNSKRIIVRQGTVGYYLNREFREFLMPIYYFEGDNGFVAYAQAIAPEWIERSAVSPNQN